VCQRWETRSRGVVRWESLDLGAMFPVDGVTCRLEVPS
jgi:hypothetical protein